MGKPGDREAFESDPLTLDEWHKWITKELEDFVKNLKNLESFNNVKKTDFEWFYTFGAWNEAIEFLDEYPGYWSEGWRELWEKFEKIQKLILNNKKKEN